ncbi:uncharacterized protein [Argopecten irradians]|uniref:uncharacterized protein n=1 Tax=Argopecten irradians TaxID=31199 RepID=UPI0037111977
MMVNSKNPFIGQVTQFLSEVLPKWKSFSFSDQMKTKNFYICLLFIAATSTSIWLLTNPSPNLHTIVSQTHKQINNIKNIPTNIRTSNEEEFKVDHVYLDQLGFYDKDAKVVGDDFKETPIIGTSVLPGHYEETLKFVKSTQKMLPQNKILIYDLGISSSESQQMVKFCNKTRTCSLKVFPLDKFPSHIRYLDTKSYRPLAIQETLKEYGAVIWLEPPEHFTTSKLNKVLVQAQKEGIAAWTIQEPASALIHPKMFKYFKTKQDNYYFLRAAKANQLIIYNTAKIRQDLMLPWVKCALTEECINPTGAQNFGCNYDLKPRFRYMGCHKYDMAALNVILGLMFEFSESPYEVEEEIFGVLVMEHSGNSTYPRYVTRDKLTQIR